MTEGSILFVFLWDQTVHQFTALFCGELDVLFMSVAGGSICWSHNGCPRLVMELQCQVKAGLNCTFTFNVNSRMQTELLLNMDSINSEF